MKVKDLIDRLKEVPEDAEVFIPPDEGGSSCSSVSNVSYSTEKHVSHYNSFNYHRPENMSDVVSIVLT